MHGHFWPTLYTTFDLEAQGQYINLPTPEGWKAELAQVIA